MAFELAGRVRCLYCGGASAWFECECYRAREVREGKRMKPRHVYRGGRLIIVVDEEAAANCRTMARYPAEPGSANYRGPAPVDKMLENTGFVDNVDAKPVHEAPKEGEVDKKWAAIEARKAYKRDWIRRQRERKKPSMT